MITKKFQNNDQIFNCKICNYTGKRLSQYERHLQTKKHLKQAMITNDNKKVPKNIYSCECGKIYKYNSGYSRHKKTCEYISKKNNE